MTNERKTELKSCLGSLFELAATILIRGAIVWWGLQIVAGAFPTLSTLSTLNYWQVCVISWAIRALFPSSIKISNFKGGK